MHTHTRTRTQPYCAGPCAAAAAAAAIGNSVRSDRVIFAGQQRRSVCGWGCGVRRPPRKVALGAGKGRGRSGAQRYAAVCGGGTQARRQRHAGSRHAGTQARRHAGTQASKGDVPSLGGAPSNSHVSPLRLSASRPPHLSASSSSLAGDCLFDGSTKIGWSARAASLWCPSHYCRARPRCFACRPSFPTLTFAVASSRSKSGMRI